MRVFVRAILMLVVAWACLSPTRVVLGQTEDTQVLQTRERIEALESKVKTLEEKTSERTAASLAMMLSGAFCALWAQNTGRNAWLWFFLGAVFNVIALIVLLNKNSNDRFERRVFRRTQIEQDQMRERGWL
ncbi:hypothetical protein ACXR0O_16695 [Verrucomicrobiota bacterium sgz303538]